MLQGSSTWWMPGRQEPHLNEGRFKIRNHSSCDIRPRSFFLFILILGGCFFFFCSGSGYTPQSDKYRRLSVRLGETFPGDAVSGCAQIGIDIRGDHHQASDTVTDTYGRAVAWCSVMSLLGGFSPPCPAGGSWCLAVVQHAGSFPFPFACFVVTGCVPVFPQAQKQKTYL